MDLHSVIVRPLVTEKILANQGIGNRYAFVVERHADKGNIRSAIEHLFKVHVKQINTSILRGKTKKVGRSIGRKSNWKKAIVTLKPGDKIELFEGV